MVSGLSKNKNALFLFKIQFLYLYYKQPQTVKQVCKLTGNNSFSWEKSIILKCRYAYTFKSCMFPHIVSLIRGSNDEKLRKELEFFLRILNNKADH